MRFGLQRQPGDAGVDHHDLHTALHEVDHPVAVEAVGVGAQRVVAPQDHELGAAPVRVVVAVRELLRAVGHGVAAARGGHAGDARQVAGQARESEARVVRGTVGPSQAGDPGGDVAAGALAEDDGLGTVLVADLDELAGNEVDRLVPAHALPLVLAAVLRIALHGIHQTILVVGDFRKGQATHAQATVVVRVLGVAFHLDQLAVVIGVQQHAAPEVAARTRPRASASDGQIPLLVLVRLLMRNGQILVFSHELHLSSRLVLPAAKRIQ